MYSFNRQSQNKRNFKDAIDYCILDDGETFNGPYVDLMQVSKLRHLKNPFSRYYGEYSEYFSGYGNNYGYHHDHYDKEYYHYDEEYHHHDKEYHHGYDYVHFDHKDGPFRVNAIKAHDGYVCIFLHSETSI